MHLPPGVAAMLSTVDSLPRTAAAEGTCGPDSLVGHATAVRASAATRVTPAGGRSTSRPLRGAPFGLSIVTPAIAGPFNLGNVVVRSTIFVDPDTAAVTILSDRSRRSSKACTTGIPRSSNSINVDRRPAGLRVQPDELHADGNHGHAHRRGRRQRDVLLALPGGELLGLPFQPKLTASTRGNAPKPTARAFTVKVTAAPGQANIAKIKLGCRRAAVAADDDPESCPDATFNANPAACQEGSIIGTATIHTPVLKSPLTGPAYLVSHGGAAFPDVEFLLQGEGVTLILDGQTDIKKGFTYSTFNSVPDAPITTLRNGLPEGPHSALTSNVAESKHFSLCGAKLVMPTTITGQNGVVITQETKIPVGGCGAVKGLKESARRSSQRR